MYLIIREQSVRIRGWDYPHYDPHDAPKVGKNYVEQSCDWKFFIEFWRYYQSGQFVHYFVIREDWMTDNPFGTIPQFEPGEALWYESTIYTFTEIYELASRLASRSLLGESCTISVKLHGTNGRRLVPGMSGRLLRGIYRCEMDSIESNVETSTANLIARSADLAAEQSVFVFHRFDWGDITAQAVKAEQTELLQKRR